MNTDNTAQRIDGRVLFHRMLNSRRNPEKAYELLFAIAEEKSIEKPPHRLTTTATKEA